MSTLEDPFRQVTNKPVCKSGLICGKVVIWVFTFGKGSVALSIKQRGLILVGVPLLFELVFIASIGSLLYSAEQEAKREIAARVAIERINAGMSAVYEAVRLYVGYSNFHEPPLLKRLEDLSVEMGRRSSALHDQFASSPKQLRNIDKARDNVAAVLLQLTASAKASDTEPGYVQLFTDKIEAAKLAAHIELALIGVNAFRQEQQKVEAVSKARQLRLRSITAYLMAGGLAANIAICGWLAVFFGTGITRRLFVIAENSRKLEALEPLNAPIEGDDEIADVDRGFHQMAAVISELVRKERAVLSNTADVIFSIDASGYFTAINPACSERWGFQPEQILGRNLTELSVNEKCDTFVEEMISSAGPVVREARLAKCNGEVIDVVMTGQWSAAESSAFCVTHDITERKELEAMKQGFLHMCSHDMRSPLSTIAFSAELILEGACGEVPQAVRTEIERISRLSEQLRRMVTELLDLEKLDSGVYQLTMEEGSVRDLIVRSIEAVSADARKQELKIVAPSVDMTCRLDGERIVQVLSNLLSNAIKYSRRGGTINVRLDVDSVFVRVSVEDTGEGIPPEQQEKIFEKFHQNQGAGKKGGYGIGLALCKAVVNAHQGTIGVNSEQGKGSTFWFTIPRIVDQTISQVKL